MASTLASQTFVHRAWQLVGERIHEYFNGRMRDELLNREIFYSLKEPKLPPIDIVLIFVHLGVVQFSGGTSTLIKRVHFSQVRQP